MFGEAVKGFLFFCMFAVPFGVPLFFVITFVLLIIHLVKPDSKRIKIASFVLVTLAHLGAVWFFALVWHSEPGDSPLPHLISLVFFVVSNLLILILLIASIKRRNKWGITLLVVLLLLYPAISVSIEFIPGTDPYTKRKLRKQLEENGIGKQKALRIALQGRDPDEFEIISYREVEVSVVEEDWPRGGFEGSLVYSFQIVSKKDQEKRRKYGKIDKKSYDKKSNPKGFKYYYYDPNRVRPRSEYIGKYLHVDVNGETGEVERCEFVYDTDVENPVSEDPDYPPCK